MNNHKLPQMSKAEAQAILTNFMESFPHIYRGYDRTIPEFTQTPEQVSGMKTIAEFIRTRQKSRNLKNKANSGFLTYGPNGRTFVTYGTRGERRRQQLGRA